MQKPSFLKKMIFSFLIFFTLIFISELFFRIAIVENFFGHSVNYDRSDIYYHVDEERLHSISYGDPISRKMAIVGDSFTRGVGVQIDDRFSSKLEIMLNANKKAKPFRIFVFDEPGTSTFQQIRLVEAALNHDPELIVLSVCLNDTEDWARPNELHEWRKNMIPKEPSKSLQSFLNMSKIANLLYNKMQTVKSNRGYIDY